MKIMTILSAAVALVLFAGSASAYNNCLRPKYIESWRIVGKDTLIIRQGPNDEYKLSLLGPCRNIDFARSLAIRSHTMCVENGDSISFRQSGLTQTCAISKVETYQAPKAVEKPPENAPAQSY